MSEEAPLIGKVEIKEISVGWRAGGMMSLAVFGMSGLALGKSWDESGEFAAIFSVHVSSMLLALISVPKCIQNLGERGVSNVKKYDPRWDRAKFWLTQLVAQSHFIYNWYMSKSALAIFWRNSLEWFLMSSYTFLSGYLSPADFNARRLRALWSSLALCYTVSQLGYLVLIHYTSSAYSNKTKSQGVWSWALNYGASSGNDYLYLFWYPYNHLWYIMTLIQWRLMAPFWMKLRRPLVMAVLTCILFIGYNGRGYPEFEGVRFLAWNRTLSYFPFYVTGIIMRKRYNNEFLALFEQTYAKRIALATLCTLLIGNMLNTAFATPDSCRYQWFSLSCQLPSDDTGWFNLDSIDMMKSFQSTYGPSTASFTYLFLSWYGLITKFAAQAVGIISAFTLFGSEPPAFLASIINTQQCGTDSLINYICHLLSIMLAAAFGLFNSRTYLRFFSAIIIASLQAQVWMSPRIAIFIKTYFLMPFWSKFLIVTAEDDHQDRYCYDKTTDTHHSSLHHPPRTHQEPAARLKEEGVVAETS